MHNADKTVTIYRKKWNEENAVDVYSGTVISGVSFFSRISTAINTDGQKAACEGILRIPLEALPDGLEIKSGDLICEGALQTAITTPGELDSLCPHVFTVASVTRNTSGRAPHIRVVCE
jgi:hypothetical protein